MATDEEVEALFAKKERKKRPPVFCLDTPFGRLRAALNLSMVDVSRIFDISTTIVYMYESGRYKSIPYDRILKLYRYAREHGIELEPELVEELDMEYKDIRLRKRDIHLNGVIKKKGKPSRVDDYTREPLTPIQALRYRMQVKFLDWIELIDLSYNQALMYERGGSIVPIDLGKRMQEIARQRGIAITLDELYQNVVARGVTKDGVIMKWRDYIKVED